MTNLGTQIGNSAVCEVNDMDCHFLSMIIYIYKHGSYMDTYDRIHEDHPAEKIRAIASIGYH